MASGSGTNAENIIKYFADNHDINVHLVLSNKPEAYVLTRAENHHIPTLIFNRPDFYETGFVRDRLISEGIDLIALAGFLWLIPGDLIKAFPDKMVNIHPALLPKYGGKGMYGSHVHKAVLENNEKESGISIHYVNEKYDEGAIIFQAKCPVLPGDTPDSLAERIHVLEYKHYPEVIEKLLSE